MTVDVGAVAALGRGAMASAIATSGTRVDVLADPDDTDSTVDFETLEVTDPTGERSALSNLAVLLVRDGTDSESTGRERETHPAFYRATFAPTVNGITEGMVLKVRRCPNGKLVGARLLVLEVIEDPLSIGLTVRARRL